MASARTLSGTTTVDSSSSGKSTSVQNPFNRSAVLAKVNRGAMKDGIPEHKETSKTLYDLKVQVAKATTKVLEEDEQVFPPNMTLDEATTAVRKTLGKVGDMDKKQYAPLYTLTENVFKTLEESLNKDGVTPEAKKKALLAAIDQHAEDFKDVNIRLKNELSATPKFLRNILIGIGNVVNAILNGLSFNCVKRLDHEDPFDEKKLVSRAYRAIAALTVLISGLGAWIVATGRTKSAKETVKRALEPVMKNPAYTLLSAITIKWIVDKFWCTHKPIPVKQLDELKKISAASSAETPSIETTQPTAPSGPPKEKGEEASSLAVEMDPTSFE